LLLTRLAAPVDPHTGPRRATPITAALSLRLLDGTVAAVVAD
jgi:hypothetical protein